MHESEWGPGCCLEEMGGGLLKMDSRSYIVIAVDKR